MLADCYGFQNYKVKKSKGEVVPAYFASLRQGTCFEVQTEILCG